MFMQIKSHQKDWLSLANISKSSMWQIAQKQYLFESMCQFIEQLLCHGRATTMLMMMIAFIITLGEIM